VKGAAEDWYYVDEGQVREILDDASVEAEGISLPVPSNVQISQLSGLAWGPPIAANGVLLSNRTTGAFGIYVTGEFYEVDVETAKAIDLTRWFTAAGGSLSALGLSAVDKTTVIHPFVKDSLGNFWVITPDGRQRVTAASPFAPEVATVSSKLLAFITTLDGAIGTPALVKIADQKSTYYVTPGVARLTPSAADRAGLSEYLAQPETITLTAPAFAQLTLSTPVLAPASLVKSKTSGQVYLINGWTRALKMPDQNALDALSLGVPRTVNETSLAGYQTNASFSGLKFVCDGVTYLPVNGLALRIEAADAAHYPGRATKLAPAVCQKFVVSDQPAGRFVFDETTRKYFLIDGGKRRPIATAAAYRKLATGLTKSFVADVNLLARVPVGVAAPATLTSGGTTNGGSSGGGSNSGGSSGGSTGGGSNTSTTYTVVAGDTLSKIATKFKTTVDLLLKANNLASANLIKVGQKLTIVVP
jgi:LysM repeat protein